MPRFVRIHLLVAFIFAFMSGTGVAVAFNESGTVDPLVTDCNGCHGRDYTAAGPHGGYTTTSSKCVTCHSVHGTPAGTERLLSGPTIQETCNACHDGTGGQGVYGVLAARGLSPTSRHRIDVTGLVPGGDASDGGSSTVTFTGEDSYLSCDDCHSPHGSSVVESFTGDRMRTATDTAEFKSTRLLRRRPTGATTDIARYGSDWCGACHQGRMSESSVVHNHPVDSLVTTSTPFYYERVSRVTTENATSTEFGSVGRTNRGYVIPYPRSNDQTGHAPICQQCHEDAREVGSPGAVQQFRVTAPDGTNSSDNPRFQTFPHESTSSALLVETGESLCLNCHDSGSQMP